MNSQILVVVGDGVIFVPRHAERLHVMQAASRPDGEDLSGVVTFVPGAAVLLPNGGLDGFLDIGAELVRYIPVEEQAIERSPPASS